jgi:hypothetical protein
MNTKYIAVAVITFGFAYFSVAKAETFGHQAVLQKIVKERSQRDYIASLSGKEKLGVSMFLTWIQDEATFEGVKALNKGLYLACDVGGFSVIGGYYGGYCSAISISKSKNGSVVTLQMMRANSLRFGADAGYTVGGGNDVDNIHNGSTLGTFTVHGLNETTEIPGVYIKAASSGALVAGGTVTWVMAKVRSDGLSGSYLDAQEQVASLEIGAIYGEATLYRAVSKPITFNVQLD